MNEPNELNLRMTPEKVKEILGEPDNLEKDSRGAITFYYAEPNKEHRIRFVDGSVVHIRTFGVEKVSNHS